MPKLKTNKAAKKRFRVSKTGKIKRGRPGRRHLLSVKTSKRKRKLRLREICPPGDARKVRTLLRVE